MVAHIEKRQGDYVIALIAEMMDQLHAGEGSAVELRPASGSTVVEYVSTGEALEAYERSKAQFAQAYEALAK